MPEPQPADDDHLLTLEEAAEVLRISTRTASRLAARGELPGIRPKVGRSWRVSANELEVYLKTPVRREAR